MFNPNFIILYVDNPLSSAIFYEDIFGKSATEIHPTFVSFALDSGITFCLWSKHTAVPSAQLTGGGGEIAFSVPTKENVNFLYQQGTARGWRVLQKPTFMDFGYTFVILDPDNHRLRVFWATNTED